MALRDAPHPTVSVASRARACTSGLSGVARISSHIPNRTSTISRVVRYSSKSIGVAGLATITLWRRKPSSLAAASNATLRAPAYMAAHLPTRSPSVRGASAAARGAVDHS